MPIVKVQGIILAAGLSRRMGFPKLGVMIDRVPLLERVIRAALESSLDRVIVVERPESQGQYRSSPWCAYDHRLKMVINPEPEQGMSSSMRAGLAHVDRDSDGVMILLGDQPRIRGALIDELIGAFGTDPGRIVYPMVMGRKTTPAVIPRCLYAELETVTGDRGARDVIRRHADLVLAVEMGDRYDDRDIDTPDDLSAVFRHPQGKAPGN